MTNKSVFFIVLISFTILFSCSKSENPQNSQEWLIPKNEVFDGGPGKDGIPSVDKPVFGVNSAINFMKDDDLVLAVWDGNTAKAYPHPILDWHEIVNDKINGKEIAVVYCPLTGTGIGFDRMIGGQLTTFGVSGLLYQNNIIPYDRKTNSNWSQMRLECVNGPLLGTKVVTAAMTEMSWKTWKEMYPNGSVMTSQTSFNRNYGVYPYNDYKTSRTLLFPGGSADDRLHPKDRVLGVIMNDQMKAFPVAAFGGNAKIINDELGGQKIVVAGNANKNFVVSFVRTVNDEQLTFTAVQNELPIILSDQEGNKWDIFGRAVSGPRTGQNLEPAVSFIGYWFAWSTFYPDVKLYQ